MPAAFNKGATLIALKEVRAGGRTHLPGDHFRWRHYAITERTVALLIDQRQVGELSQETFDIAVARRSADLGRVPHGFTRDGLTAVGIEVPPELDAEPEAPAAPPAFADYDEVTERDGYTVAMRKAGIVATYDVFQGDARLNPSRLRGEKQLEAFLATLQTDRARIAEEATKPAEPQGDAPGETQDEGGYE